MNKPNYLAATYHLVQAVQALARVIATLEPIHESEHSTMEYAKLNVLQAERLIEGAGNSPSNLPSRKGAPND